MDRFNIQVDRDHYYSGYDSFYRFLSYHHLIGIVNNLLPGLGERKEKSKKTFLEIGVGNKTVYNYLKNNKVNIKSLDFDVNLEPDYIGDVRNLPFENKAFDYVLCAEVLEHIPYEDFIKSLKELNRITANRLVISLPYSCIAFNMFFRVTLLGKLFKRDFFNLFFRIPSFKKPCFDGEHYWEIGRKGYSLNKVKRDLERFFYIEKEGSPLLNPIHYFFVLKPKEV
jgi:hypothetical protein